MTRQQNRLWWLLALAAVAGSIGSEFPHQMLLQHVPTALAVVLLPVCARRVPLSNLAFSCLVALLLLHVLGARYIYSYVPYDDWFQRLFGFNLSRTFGFERNHYDRLVHFAFGALAVRPAWEVLTRSLEVPVRYAWYATVEFVLAFSLLYELFEWALTLLLSPQDAGEYNGQQGDIWDAHRDMSLALLGSLLALMVARVAAGISSRRQV